MESLLNHPNFVIKLNHDFIQDRHEHRHDVHVTVNNRKNITNIDMSIDKMSMLKLNQCRAYLKNESIVNRSHIL